MDSAARFLVSGRVQGVCFRAGTRDQAERLGLRGHACNLADGSVEVLAAGEPVSIEQLAAWLRHGPPHARVDQVTRSPAEPGEAGAGFRIA